MRLIYCLAVVGLIWGASGCGDGASTTTMDVHGDLGGDGATGRPCTSWEDCDDDNVCTAHECVEGKCVDIDRLGHGCNDNSVCTTDDVCKEGGVCEGELTVTCDDSNVCTDDFCDAKTGCIHENFLAEDKISCDDGNPCTVDDLCDSGECSVSIDLVCEANPDPCIAYECDVVTGQCTVLVSSSNETECSDDDPCTVGDLCDGEGNCVPGTELECKADHPCKKALCDSTVPGGCVIEWADEGTKCDDLNVCTILDKCYPSGDTEEMICKGETAECTSVNPCQVGECKIGLGCTYSPTKEGLPCGGEFFECVNGECVCVPQCEEIECGSDSCGGVCGSCLEGSKCFLGKCLEPGLDCDDGNDVDWDGCNGGEIVEFRVDPVIGPGGLEPDVVVLPDGVFLVSWRGAAGGVWVQTFSADGWPLGEVKQVSSGADVQAREPTMAVLWDGSVAFVWGDHGAGKKRVYSRVMDWNGDWAGAPVEVVSGSGDQDAPALGALSTGGYVVTWTRKAPLGGDLNLRARRFAGSGQPTGDVVEVDTAGKDVWQPAAAGLTNGGYVLVWEHEMPEVLGEPGQYTSAYGQVYTAGDQLTGYSFAAWTGKILGETYPSVVGLENGGFLLLWNATYLDPAGVTSIMGRPFADNGTPLGGLFVVGGGDQPAFRPQAATLPGGTVVTVWEQDGGVRATVVNSDWTTKLEEWPVGLLTEGAQDRPQVASTGDGGFIVVWRSDWPSSPGAIMAQRYDAQGGVVYR